VRTRLVTAVVMGGLAVLLGATTLMAAADQQGIGPCPEAMAAPVNLLVDDMLQPLVAEMYAQSPTFREQCRRIAAARYLRVFVRPVFARTVTTARARATISRFSEGAIIATVFLPTPLRHEDALELIAHELEHVIEQIDRVDLARLADTGAGASRLADGAFETERARRAGRTVAAETLGANEPALAASPTLRLGPSAAAVRAVRTRR
jgi:hypothetical protein